MFHIFFSADENYIKFVAPLIFSIIKSTKSNQKFINFAHSQNNDCTEGYVFHILSAKAINSDSIQRLELLCTKLSNIYPCNVVNHAVNDKLFAENNVPIWKGNYQAYLRFFIDNFLDPEVSSCLYLDVDMIVLDDIRRLWTVDITNATLMVAHLPDVFNQNFFNSGFIFFNIKKWRENNYQSKCIDYTIKHRSLDQDTLNAVIKKDNLLILPKEWNYCLQTFQSDDEAILSKSTVALIQSGIKIIHYIRPKPWLPITNWIVKSKGKCFRYQNVIDIWWHNAIDTPFFSDELLKLKSDLNTINSKFITAHFNYLTLLSIKVNEFLYKYMH